MIPRIEALNELTRLSQEHGMYDVMPSSHKLHLVNKAVAVNDDGSLKLTWCVTREDGARLTEWMSYKGAESKMGKMIAQRENMI